MEIVLLIVLIILIAISAFFSGSETGMMSLNRYRLRHLARRENKSAALSQDLLKRPDRLLAMILIGNTFANIIASAIATLLAFDLFGDLGVVIGTIILTLLILVFAEVLPKTMAALYPEKFAFAAVYPLSVLLKISYPLVWLLNIITLLILRPFGIKLKSTKLEPLSSEEIRTLVHESKDSLAKSHSSMLLGVLDLDNATIEDVLIPRNKIKGINLNDSNKNIIRGLTRTQFSRLPVYKDDLEELIGIFNLKDGIKLLNEPTFNKEALRQLITPPYFVPESATLQQQLIQFQQSGEQLGIVVDEYGDIQGIVTIDDILEEIVGQIDKTMQSPSQDIKKDADGNYIVDGDITIRDLNRQLNLNWPTKGPKTLGGIVSEQLESIPVENSCVLIHNRAIEIIKVDDNALKKAKISKDPILYAF